MVIVPRPLQRHVPHAVAVMVAMAAATAAIVTRRTHRLPTPRLGAVVVVGTASAGLEAVEGRDGRQPVRLLRTHLLR